MMGKRIKLNNGIFKRNLRIMLAKFIDFNISGYALTNVTLSFKFAFKKYTMGDYLLDILFCRTSAATTWLPICLLCVTWLPICPLGAWWTVYEPQVTLQIMGSKYALAMRKMYVRMI